MARYWVKKLPALLGEMQKNMFDAAKQRLIAEWKEFAADTGDPEVINRWNAVWKTFQTSGHLAAMRTLAELQIQASTYIPPSFIASTYFTAGERERGFAWLERAYNERDDYLEGFRTDPAVAPFRSDPRYADLLRRMGLPQ